MAARSRTACGSRSKCSSAVRAAWPQDKPICTRISSVDWVEGGTTIEDAIEIARMLHEAGNDILAVSSGGV